MSERLTEERLEKLEKDVRMYYDSGVLAYPVFAIGDILEIITALREERVKHQAARAELEAAREVVKRAMRSLREPRGYTSETDIALYEAIKHYDALRSQQTTTGCYDPWGLERSEDATTGERSK